MADPAAPVPVRLSPQDVSDTHYVLVSERASAQLRNLQVTELSDDPTTLLQQATLLRAFLRTFDGVTHWPSDSLVGAGNYE